jgi:integrase
MQTEPALSRGTTMPKVRLTALFVRSAVCPDGYRKVNYFDNDVSGFLLEVRSTGGKTYYQRYRDGHGRERQYKIGPASVLTVVQARKAARNVLAKRLLGEDLAEKRAMARAVPTMAEFSREKYLPYVQTYKRSWQTDERLLRIHVLPRIGKLYMDEVKPEHFYQMLASMKAAGYAPGTCARPVIIARYMFSLARRWKISGVLENPASGIPLPRDIQRNRFLEHDEIERLIYALDHDTNQVAAKAILLLLLTGARRNEITHAKWEHLDLERGQLLVPLSKSGKPRIVILNRTACNVLRSTPRPGDNPYIFPSPITGQPSPSLFFPWDRVRKTAGIPDVRLHDLRHSFASLLINEDHSLYEVQELLGHSNPRTTQRYAHLRRQKLAQTAEAVGIIVERLMTNRPPNDTDSNSGSGPEHR